MLQPNELSAFVVLRFSSFSEVKRTEPGKALIATSSFTELVQIIPWNSWVVHYCTGKAYPVLQASTAFS